MRLVTLTSKRVGTALAGVGLACAVLACASPALAQGAYPSRPISLVIPFPPGGATDVLGRMLGTRLSAELGQPLVIENRAGAGTVIGATFVSKAAPDGYTLLLSSGTTFTVNPAIRPNLPYDPIKSFDPVGIAARTGLVLLANKDVPVNSVKEFVDYVRQAPGKYSWASFGTGTTSQFAGETILNVTGLKMAHIPYNGSAPAMTDLMGGQVSFSIDTVNATLPQLKSGKIKAVAVTTSRRSELMPTVPTMAESGYSDINIDTWLILAAPKGIAPEIRARLEKALAAAIGDAEFRLKLKAQGFEPAFSDAAQASEQIRRELPLMKAIALRANIKAD
jgi:tripartite-type tricarboxylate transporter receptor subunit TctC